MGDEIGDWDGGLVLGIGIRDYDWELGLQISWSPFLEWSLLIATGAQIDQTPTLPTKSIHINVIALVLLAFNSGFTSHRCLNPLQ